LNKWAPLNWVFVRRCIEKVLELDRSLTGPFLRELFDEATQPGTGFAAMDFGYAFDSLIWDMNQDPSREGHAERIADIIAEAIRVEIVPKKYLTDAEILVMISSGEDFRTSDSFIGQKSLLEAISI